MSCASSSWRSAASRARSVLRTPSNRTGERHAAHERLEREEVLRARRLREGPEAGRGAQDRKAGQRERRRRGPGLAEAERRPEERREDEVRVHHDAARRVGAEDQRGDDAEQGQRRARLEPARRGPRLVPQSAAAVTSGVTRSTPSTSPTHQLHQTRA